VPKPNTVETLLMSPAAARPAADKGTRFAMYSWVSLLAQALFLFLLSIRHYVLHTPNSPMMGSDFAVFWSAARVAIEHGAAAAYVPEFMKPLEASVRTGPYTPWVYPPTFLAVVIPLGRLSFGAAYLCFSALSLALYLYAWKIVAKPLGVATWRYALAFPAVFLMIGFGQNSLLTAALAALALHSLRDQPKRAGLLISLMCVKPQLAVLFPLALILGRHWQALIVAALLSCLWLGLSAILLGGAAYPAFWHALSAFHQEWVVENSNRAWSAMTSLYAILRLRGASDSLAGTVQMLSILIAVPSFAWIGWVRARATLCAAAFGIATLLVQPYMVFYDLAYLSIPIGFLALDMRKYGATRTEIAVLVAAWLAPVQAAFAQWIPAMPQLAPAVLYALLAVVLARAVRERHAFVSQPA
jgi:hypothetical protein